MWCRAASWPRGSWRGTRRLIADTAARLFAERGYERVAVSEVARAAEVAEQTVYNYFPTKEQLVTDREQQVQDRLCDLIRSRPPAVTPAAAIRGFVLEAVAGIRTIPPEIWRGELGYLAAISPAVHRLVLELTDRQAAALATAISDTTAVAPEIARLQGIALAAVFQIIISEAGQRTRDGQSQADDRRRASPGGREHPRRARPLAERPSTASTAVAETRSHMPGWTARMAPSHRAGCCGCRRCCSSAPSQRLPAPGGKGSSAVNAITVPAGSNRMHRGGDEGGAGSRSRRAGFLR